MMVVGSHGGQCLKSSSIAENYSAPAAAAAATAAAE